MSVITSTRTLRSWLPCTGGVVFVFVAICFAASRLAATKQDISELTALSAQLGEAAQIMCATTMAPEKSEALQDQQADLRQRVREAGMPALVQAELMSTARTAGLDVKEIQPVAAPGQARDKGGDASGSGYRVQVSGTYQQVAEYMLICRRQRLPARVRAFRISRPLTEQGRPAPLLTADITLESFQPADGTLRLARGS